MKNIKVFKKGILVAAVISAMSCNDFQLSENFDVLKLSYQSGFVMAEDTIQAHVTVNADDLNVDFKLRHGTTNDGVICENNFAITNAQLDELRQLVSEVTYYVQDPSTGLGIADLDHLNLELDDETYEIRDPNLEEAGKFISPTASSTCELRLKLKEWVEASGLVDDCPQEAAEQLFPEACEIMPHGPQ